MSFSERLNRAMIEAGYTQGRLAKAVGMAQSSVNKLLNGASSSRKTVEIASVLGVRPEWLSTGSGLMRDDGRQPESIGEGKVDANIFRIEVLDFSVSAGPGAINNEFVEVLHSVEYPVEEARHMERLSLVTYCLWISAYSDLMGMVFTHSFTTKLLT